MSQRKYKFVPGEFYHIYNRGNDKRTIFVDEEDHRRFQMLLHILNSTELINIRDFLKSEPVPFEHKVKERLVSIGAYCLMPNHYHLLLTPCVENGISLFMQKLSTSYVMFFNKKYERTGTLFEGKFKSQFISNDQYLKYLFSYIHLNPVKMIQSDWKEVGICDKYKAQAFLNTYEFSSFVDSRLKRKESIILDMVPFPDYFDIGEQEKEALSWLETQP